MSASFEIKIPVDNEHLVDYERSISEKLRVFWDPSRKGRPSIKEIFLNDHMTPSPNNVPNKVVEVILNIDSPLLPKWKDSPIPYTILNHASAYLVFNRIPVPVDSLRTARYIESIGVQGDLMLVMISKLGRYGLYGEHGVQINFDSNKIALVGRMNSDPKYWKTTGNIVGMPDVDGSQLVIYLPSYMSSGIDDLDNCLGDIRRKFELEKFTITMSKGRVFRITKEMLCKVESADGLPLYVYNFPLHNK
jgi:hypothetical protein